VSPALPVSREPDEAANGGSGFEPFDAGKTRAVVRRALLDGSRLDES